MYFYLTAIFSILTDTISKYSANHYLVREISIIWDNLTLKLAHNSWIAFSIPVYGIVLKSITILLITGIFAYYIRNEQPKKSRYLDSAFWFIIWGAIGNAIERILYSEVTDFIKIKYFAIFNFGDIFINVWVIILLTLYINKTWTTKK
ncbi:MAG: hypothetical protein ACD_2C00107G0004 [uncultured bacterium (gcode 4)]|uniref:Uncharacterized protein n=1 Tax=uncultured bacterium (gcode 4) TaxID=1234023 RepID=K2GH49_9BACT|nr:MAG: hypothetical protein ACD_2C00107G0004 [uncultured bacterium (gcode 4)]